MTTAHAADSRTAHVPADPDAGAGSSNRPPVRRARARNAALAVAVGLLAFVVSMIGSWIPSFWGDEGASVMSAERPWASLIHELTRVDAVHGTYYALLHVWIDFFGATELSVRLPSAIAVGFAASGVLVLVRRFGGTRLALMAAMVFAVLPRTTYMGMETRSYALGTACAVWLAVLFLALVVARERRVLPWVGFGLAYAACIYVFLYLALMALPFAAALAWMSRAPLRALWLRWGAASLGGILLTAPLLAFALKEHGQLAFLGRNPAMSVYTFLVSQWFDTDIGLAVIGWACLLALAVGGIVMWLRRRAVTHPAGPRMLPAGRSLLLALAASWFVLPPAALLLLNAFIPAYTARYTSFVTPAVAILLSVALEAAAVWIVGTWRERVHTRTSAGATRPGRARRASGAWAAVAVALIAAVSVSAYLAQRGPYSKPGASDWAEVAQVIQDHSRPGDDIVFDETVRPSRDPHIALHLYPDQFENVVDVTLAVPYVDRDALWDKTYSIPRVADRIADGNGRVWLVEYTGTNPHAAPTAGMRKRLAELHALGFSISRSYRLHRDDVYLLVRGSTT